MIDDTILNTPSNVNLQGSLPDFLKGPIDQHQPAESHSQNVLEARNLARQRMMAKIESQLMGRNTEAKLVEDNRSKLEQANMIQSLEAELTSRNKTIAQMKTKLNTL